MSYSGSCHCGAINFAVDADFDVASECNCSICHKSGFVHWLVPHAQVRLVGGWESLDSYVWGSGIARHYFCRVCGISPLRRPRLSPDKVSVNVRCLDDFDFAALLGALGHFDGLSLPIK